MAPPRKADKDERVVLGSIVDEDASLRTQEMSRTAAGLALTVAAANHELWRLVEANRDDQAEVMQTQYERLMQVVYRHPEATALLSWLTDR